jgi:hypothetical protein
MRAESRSRLRLVSGQAKRGALGRLPIFMRLEKWVARMSEGGALDRIKVRAMSSLPPLATPTGAAHQLLIIRRVRFDDK